MFTSISARLTIAPVKRRNAFGQTLAIDGVFTRDVNSGYSYGFSGRNVLTRDGSLFLGYRKPGTATPRIFFYDALFSIGYASGSFTVSTTGNADITTFNGGVTLQSGGKLLFSTDTQLNRDSAGVFALRQTTQAHGLRIYATYTDSSNYERGFTEWASSEFLIGTAKGGTGVARPVKFQTDGTTRAGITTAGSVYIGSGAGALSTTATDGFLYFPTCAGTPTGTPTSITGTQAVVIDSTTNKIYTYGGAAWNAISGSGGSTTRTVLSDTVSSTTYIGWATSGSATSSSVWKVWKTVYTSDGAVSSNQSAANIAWDNRYTATYV